MRADHSTVTYSRNSHYTQPSSWDLTIIATFAYGTGSKTGISVIHQNGDTVDFRTSNLLLEDLPECGATGKSIKVVCGPQGKIGFTLTTNEHFFDLKSCMNTSMKPYMLSNHTTVSHS